MSCQSERECEETWGGGGNEHTPSSSVIGNIPNTILIVIESIFKPVLIKIDPVLETIFVIIDAVFEAVFVFVPFVICISLAAEHTYTYIKTLKSEYGMIAYQLSPLRASTTRLPPIRHQRPMPYLHNPSPASSSVERWQEHHTVLAVAPDYTAVVAAVVHHIAGRNLGHIVHLHTGSEENHGFVGPFVGLHIPSGCFGRPILRARVEVVVVGLVVVVGFGRRSSVVGLGYGA